ncbi:ribonuclease E/G [Aureimonas flava]|uniref:Ribonuclease E n=1 Tax=Aureimonas flava TaxID=2320271 RepID=A0A3A1WYC0_9HYPH|nr:ribonuclease E/G [Aureimonas flava]RIY03729.1 ribonuclease E/G [Aureimonas flava]
MADKMLIDAAHPEETRVVVVKGNRVEEFDFESEHKKQIKGNIYLAKVTRVEPSLQAAFVEYGGNRHGFLAFNEIHPDYYQIPHADRQALIEHDLAQAEEDDEVEERKPAKPSRSRSRRSRSAEAKAAEATDDSVSEVVEGETGDDAEIADTAADGSETASGEAGPETAEAVTGVDEAGEATEATEAKADVEEDGKPRRGRRSRRSRETEEEPAVDEADEVDDLGSEDAMEEVPVRSNRAPRKHYKIQEVIKRRQILLVQVVKEERGNKGAALTTYLSLAGRYSVLMPNTARGGGISRKITNAADRKRLKEVARDLEVPRGMGIILRTAGANRTKAEVKRDYEYLMRLWETVRTLTLQSTAPALVYEEGSLIKRSIRDLYNKDIDQILVAGESGYREAKDFMRMLMPSQAKVVQPYRDQSPIFARQGIEAQLDKMLQPHVTLKSGGYIIINQTEALVAIDVNSGRSTREHSVEDTAYQTNLEAAEEVARQLRLRDLAGLIVVDFIDMEEKRNNRNVEKRLKDCLKDDRARIQIGRISHFGLLEMSRQRIRASVLESTTQTCPVCNGNGFIRSSSSLALQVLRSIEEHLQKHGTHDLTVKVPTATALYVLNEKRSTLDELERHYGLRILLEAVEGFGHQHVAIEHGAEATRRVKPEAIATLSSVSPDTVEIEEVVVESEAESTEEEAVARAGGSDGEEQRDGSRRRRRRRRGGRRGDENGAATSAANDDEADVDEDAAAEGDAPAAPTTEASDDEGNGGDRKRRRRGRRGGRRNRDDEAGNEASAGGDDGAEPVAELSGDDAVPELPVLAEAVPDASFEPEMTDAVEAVEGDPSEEAAEALTNADVAVPDENEVMSTTAEASAAMDGNPPLDAVFPSEDEEPVEEETVTVRRGLRLIANGEEATDEGAEEKPKRRGWWSRRSAE